MTRRVKHQYSRVQRLARLVERLVGADHHLRIAIDVDFGVRALSQNAAAGSDPDFSFVILDIPGNLKVERGKTTGVGARGLFQHDVVAIVTVELDHGLDVYSGDGPGGERMRRLYAHPIRRAFLHLSGSRNADSEDVGSDF